MDASDRVEVFVDDVVSGLQGDPELMLDARAELLSHLDEVMERHRGEGHTEDESAEYAMRVFGPVTETAGDLVNANAHRMRWRAYGRRSLHILVLPLAVIIAVATLFGMFQRDPRDLLLGVGPRGLIGSSLTRKAMATFDENLPGNFRPDACLARWEADPDQKAWLMYYVSGLYWQTTAGLDWGTFESAVRFAQQADADNALYDLILASTLAQRASRLEEKRSDVKRADGPVYAPHYELVIANRPLLDEAMGQLRQGLEKPFLRTYDDDIHRSILTAFPSACRFDDTMRSLALLGTRPTVGSRVPRELLKLAPLYGEVLAREKAEDEAEVYLSAWRPLTVHYLEAASFVDDVAMLGSFAAAAAETTAQVYERLGRTADAERARRDARLLAGVIAARSYYSFPDTFSYLRSIQRDYRLNPVITDLGPMHWEAVDMSMTRAQEYLAGEQLVISILAAVLFILLVDCAYVAFHWRHARGAASAPFLLVPPWRKVLQTIGLSIGVPGAAYFAFTRLTPWAQREWALRANISVSVLAAAFLGIAVVTVSYWTASSYIRGRCRSLQVPMPPRRLPRLRTGTALAVLLSLIGLGLVCAFVPLPDVGLPWSLVYALVLVMGFLGMVQARVIGHSLSAPEEYGLYYGTVARSLIPYFALAVIILGGVVQPALRAREAYLFERDPAMQIDPDLPGLYREEHELVERLKRDLLAELEWDEEERGGKKADAASPDALNTISIEGAVSAHEG